jgi:RNA polymerase sigma-70 factor (ECF subfamily)
MMLDDEQKLIQASLAGDSKSFERLMKLYSRKIYTFVYRMVRDEEIAAELVQDFFIKIYTVLHKYNYTYKFSTWAYRICYNLVIDYVRKKQANVDSLDDEYVSQKALLESDNYVDDCGFETLEQAEIREIVWSSVDRIPLKYRELILLRYLDGLKYEEIAEITDLPVGTIKNRIFKAKELLREEINIHGMSES